MGNIGSGFGSTVANFGLADIFLFLCFLLEVDIFV